ncbi:high-potential iron-sulfur protein [Balneolaceae bacterium ANBcel3]|nr:high-potential iron-sulfur protein [Balneolaceae bacterium ANBcel3]
MSKIASISRKDFLKKVTFLGVAGAGAGLLVQACSNGGDDTAADPCADLSGLSESDLQMREMLDYTSETPNPSERCDNCEFWSEDQFGPHCGGCTLFAGPVHPAGWCSSWVLEST